MKRINSQPKATRKPLVLKPQFPADFKTLLTHLLSKAIELIESDKIRDAGDLGIFAAHLRDVTKLLDGNENAFDLGMSGEMFSDELCERLQDTPPGWEVAWNDFLSGQLRRKVD